MPIACPTGAPITVGRGNAVMERIMCRISPLSVRCVWMTPLGSAVVPDV
jgi:hypothetical protein